MQQPQLQQLRICMAMAPGPFGGAERVFVAGTNGLADRADCLVTALVIVEARAPEHADAMIKQLSEKVTIIRLVSASRVDLGLLKSIKNLWVGHDFDVVHTNGYKASIFAAVTGVRKHTARWVMTHHGVTAHTFQVRLYERLERFAMRRADHVMAVSAAMKQALVQKNIEADRMSVVDNMLGLDVPVRAGGGLQDPQSLLFLGRLSPEKGIDLLGQAVRDAPYLCDPNNVTFDIVGDGPARMKEEQSAPPSFRFHGFSSRPAHYLMQASAMVVPSRTEGMPMAVIEALAAGVPVIGFDVGGMAELVTGGVNGVLLPAGRTDLLAKAMAAHLENPQILGDGARQQAAHVRDRFSVSAWVDATLEVYGQVLDGR